MKHAGLHELLTAGMAGEETPCGFEVPVRRIGSLISERPAQREFRGSSTHRSPAHGFH